RVLFRSPQTQYRPAPVVEFQKFAAKLRTVPSFRETPSRIAQEWSREATFNLSGGDLYRGCEDSHSLVFLWIPRERAGVPKCVTLCFANRGVPSGCCYLEVLVLVVSFPYMLPLLPVPYPQWVGIYLGYPTRIG